MRKILLVAVCAATVAGCETTPQKPNLQLSHTDPKYNSAECRSIRDKPYEDRGATEQMVSRASMQFLVGGTLTEATEQRRRELIDHKVEQACMTNPPARPHLDPSVTVGR